MNYHRLANALYQEKYNAKLAVKELYRFLLDARYSTEGIRREIFRAKLREQRLRKLFEKVERKSR